MPTKIETVKFQCDICLKHYDYEVDALECENSHLRINMKERIGYHFSNGKAYPQMIMVTFKNDKRKNYKLIDRNESSKENE